MINRLITQPALASLLKCPECVFEKQEMMPVDSCVYFYQCTNCLALLKPKQGDYCIFCSYGTVGCPPKQSAHDCCLD